MQMQPVLRHSVLAMALVIGLALLSPARTIAGELSNDAIAGYLERNPQVVERIVENYIASNPEIIEKALKELVRRHTEQSDTVAVKAIEANRQKLFANRDDVVIGNPEGDVTLVEFFDYNCHFCRSSLPDLVKLIQDDPKLRVVLKEMPILGAGSLEVARVSASVRQQLSDRKAYRDFYVRLLSEKGNLARGQAQDIAAELGMDLRRIERDYYTLETTRLLQESLDLAKEIGISGTPSYVVGNTLLKGMVGADRLKQQIALARGQQDRR